MKRKTDEPLAKDSYNDCDDGAANMKKLDKSAIALPQIPGIIGEEDFRSTAILVPLVEMDDAVHLLFELRSPHIPQGGEVCFPGGHFEEGVDLSYRDTALRETSEELGLAPEKIELLGQLDTLVSSRGLIVRCYLGVLAIDSLGELEAEAGEVEKIFSVPVQWFYDNPPEVYRKRVESGFFPVAGDFQDDLLPVEELGLPSSYRGKKTVWRPRVLVYRREPIIWGVTAAVVENVIRSSVLPR